jgi:hypothetical protein
MNTRKSGWGDYPRINPERNASRLKGRFEAVSRRSFRGRRPHWTRHFDGPVLVMVVLMLVVVGVILYRWTWNSNLWLSNQMRLQGSYIQDCATARRIGIVPLYSGYTGYREGLDRDRDGIACEPYPF